MIPDDFNRIATDAADAIRQRVGVCEIGVRRLHAGDGTWCLVFGQQPLCGEFVGLVNSISDRIKAEGGDGIVIGADATRSTWVMLARLPRLFDFRPFRLWLYEALSDRTCHTADQIRRCAAGAGESAVIEAHDLFTTIAGRVAGVVRSLQLQESRNA